VNFFGTGLQNVEYNRKNSHELIANILQEITALGLQYLAKKLELELQIYVLAYSLSPNAYNLR
jgi:hypothetical protein